MFPKNVFPAIIHCVLLCNHDLMIINLTTMLRRLNRIHAIHCYNVINHQVCGIDSHNITTRKETYEAIACYS
jgi:hypothetical protein